MNNKLTRLEWLVGEEKVAQLGSKSVALFGCGGVGSFALEALIRSGVNRMILVDGDDIDVTNMNRQLLATTGTLGMRKVDAAMIRCLQINHRIEVKRHDIYYTNHDYPFFFDSVKADYVIDAADNVESKIDIVVQCAKRNIPVISSLDTSNRLDPRCIRTGMLSEVKNSPVATAMLEGIRKEGVEDVMVVYSEEPAITPDRNGDPSTSPGSSAFVPSIVGLTLAGIAARQLMGLEEFSYAK